MYSSPADSISSPAGSAPGTGDYSSPADRLTTITAAAAAADSSGAPPLMGNVVGLSPAGVYSEPTDTYATPSDAIPVTPTLGTSAGTITPGDHQVIIDAGTGGQGGGSGDDARDCLSPLYASVADLGLAGPHVDTFLDTPALVRQKTLAAELQAAVATGDQVAAAAIIAQLSALTSQAAASPPEALRADESTAGAGEQLYEEIPINALHLSRRPAAAAAKTADPTSNTTDTAAGGDVVYMAAAAEALQQTNDDPQEGTYSVVDKGNKVAEV